MAGNLAVVENFLPGRISAHDYQLTPRDARRLSEARLIVINGLGLDAWLKEAVLRLDAAQRPRLIEFSSGLGSQLISNSSPRAGFNAGPSVNPHIWLDPKLVAVGITNISNALQELDPVNSAGYTNNASRYLERLKKLDQETETTLKELRERNIVVYHNAFAYLARRYRLEIAGVIEEVSEVPPSARHLAKISRVIRDGNLRVLFVEPATDNPFMQQLARDLNIKLTELDSLEAGTLSARFYEDGMHQIAFTLQRSLK